MEVKGADDRFFTPRGSARRGNPSEDERFSSPRDTARSVSSDDNDYVTPREPSDHSHSWSARSKAPAEAKWDDRHATSAFDYKATYSARGSGGSAVVAPPPPDNDVFSATRHNRIDSVAYMLDAGVPVNSRDEQGNTILLVACQNGLKRMVKLALRRGANINAQNLKGNTALHFCFAYGYGDSLGEYLISKGADTTIANHDGFIGYDGLGPRQSARK